MSQRTKRLQILVDLAETEQENALNHLGHIQQQDDTDARSATNHTGIY